MKVYERIIDTIGNTPLVRLQKLEEKFGLKAKLIAKVESFNPAGSVKDRIAKSMKDVKGDIVFGLQELNNTFGDYMAYLGKKQLRIKY